MALNLVTNRKLYFFAMHALREWLRTTVLTMHRHRILFLLIPVALAACGALTIHHDVAWSDRLMENRTAILRSVARRFSAFGDFQTGTLAVVGGLWLVGRWKRNRRLQNAAAACLLAATFAGATATAIRTLTGRPRPSAGVADGFYGPSFNHKYQSFASAHSATSLGTSTALAVAVPEIGIPVLVLSLGVPWSRFYMHDHYVTDILAGAGIGIWFGLAFGFAARKRNNRSPAVQTNRNGSLLGINDDRAPAPSPIGFSPH
ncbi:MAG: phosphatase PAP2 family protein [bacterium]